MSTPTEYAKLYSRMEDQRAELRRIRKHSEALVEFVEWSLNEDGPLVVEYCPTELKERAKAAAAAYRGEGT
jgi:hypothetical protein